MYIMIRSVGKISFLRLSLKTLCLSYYHKYNMIIEMNLMLNKY